MRTSTQSITFDGRFLQRGFWLYAWEVTLPDGEIVVYVGRTGDSSSANAASPFNRMAQHLGNTPTSSMLRNHLGTRGVDPHACAFRIVAHGPLFAETAKNLTDHAGPRDVIAGMEKRLAADMADAGYDVVNTVNSTKTLDEALYATVRAAFVEHFAKLAVSAEDPPDPSSASVETA